MGRIYKDVDVEVTIDDYDIEDYFDRFPEEIDYFVEKYSKQIESTPGAKTLYDQMKMDLLRVAYEKFTLEELEEKLGGNQFDLL